ncbi:MAG: flagellar protein FlgN [Pelagimonas sp.]|jgi:flagellar biosynthesis/type III secretory pathway chaperone|nr:flagellar protein FlgN [Pelagimonas sp.]
MFETDVKQRLEDLLDQERQALLDGNFDQIEKLMEKKQELAEDLETQTLPQEALSPIKDGMRRNQELFDQALAGIRNVTARIDELRQLRRSMNTYDAYGRRFTIDAPIDRKLEKRA